MMSILKRDIVECLVQIKYSIIENVINYNLIQCPWHRLNMCLKVIYI